jgi:hypothetical protein
MVRLARLCGVLLLFVEMAMFVRPAVAAMSLTVTNIPSGVDQAQEFSADISFLCSGCTSDSFLRGVLYPSGTSYFGFTKDNNGAWVNASGGSCTQYYKIAAEEIKEGSWSGTLQFKVDNESSYYQGPGDYLFKVGRYTASCGAPTWSSETTITVTGPTASPTPAPTNTPAPTSVSKPTPTRTPTPAPTLTKTPAPALTPKPTPASVASASAPTVLGVTHSPPVASADAQESDTPSVRPFIISLLCVGIGCAILSLVLVWKKRNALKPPGA